MWATTILAIVQSVPQIIELVEAIRGKGNGKAKRSDAEAALRAKEEDAGLTPSPEIDKARRALIDAQVAYTNALQEGVK